MEGFLNKKYPDLTGSKPVERAKGAMKQDLKRPEEEKQYPERKFLPHSQEERIEAYLERLDYLIKDERGWRRLKQKLVNEFTIDVTDENTLLKIANDLYESETRIAIEQGRGADIQKLEHSDELLERYKGAIHEKHDIQTRTLSSWLDYLKKNDAQYPTWFRYFVVRNLEKMGVLNKEKGEYSKRNEYTIAPFPELNSEALGFVYRMLTTGVGHNEFVYDPERDPPEQKKEMETKRTTLTRFIERKDFSKLYTFAQIETAGALNRESIQGEWVKYDQGSDHHILENVLRGKGTGWCTAEGSAYTHLEHGDFYVYFTKGTKGGYSEPRIAIRMEGDQIAEVRGVNHRQELEPQLIDIATEKYHALPGGEKFDKKSADMKQMTALTQKQEKGEPFNKDELRFLYEVDSTIEGFGYDTDPRIAELRNSRNRKEDIATMCDCAPEQIATDFLDITPVTRVFCEDTGTKLTIVNFREEQNKEKLPLLIELVQRLKETGSPARPDLSFECGIVPIDVNIEKLKDLKTALQSYKDADNGSPSWIWNEWKNMQSYKAPEATHLDVIILSYNNDPKARQSSDKTIHDMDRLNLRPATIAELIALGIVKPEFNKRNDTYLIGLGTKEVLDGGPRVPNLYWDVGERGLRRSRWAGEWDELFRFVCVRKS